MAVGANAPLQGCRNPRTCASNSNPRKKLNLLGATVINHRITPFPNDEILALEGCGGSLSLQEQTLKMIPVLLQASHGGFHKVRLWVTSVALMVGLG